MVFKCYDGHVKNELFLKIAPFQSENKDILYHYHICMMGCHLQGILLHMSYTCLTDFVHRRELRRSGGTYFPSFTQSVCGKVFETFQCNKTIENVQHNKDRTII